MRTVSLCHILFFGWHHIVELAPAEYVNVKVRHFLVAMLAHIDKQAITVRNEAGLAGDLTNGTHEASDFRVRRLSREVIPRYVRSTRNDKYMDRRLWIDVVKRDRELVFIDER